MADLRESQLETLRFVATYRDGLGAWELAACGPGGNSIRSAESRLHRLIGSGHLAERRYANVTLCELTDKGRQALGGDDG